MEVVEAAAAQLETLKFGGTGFGGGHGEAAPSPDAVPVSEPPPPPPSDEGAPDAGRDAGAQPAGEQPPALALSTAVGGPEPPPGGTGVTGPGAAEPVPTPDSPGTSDSDSDRSGACGSRGCGERARVTGGRSRGPRGPGREGRPLALPAHVWTSGSDRPFRVVHRRSLVNLSLTIRSLFPKFGSVKGAVCKS